MGCGPEMLGGKDALCILRAPKGTRLKDLGHVDAQNEQEEAVEG